jgi:hypothetical protein
VFEDGKWPQITNLSNDYKLKLCFVKRGEGQQEGGSTEVKMNTWPTGQSNNGNFNCTYNTWFESFSVKALQPGNTGAAWSAIRERMDYHLKTHYVKGARLIQIYDFYSVGQ